LLEDRITNPEKYRLIVSFYHTAIKVIERE